MNDKRRLSNLVTTESLIHEPSSSGKDLSNICMKLLERLLVGASLWLLLVGSSYAVMPSSYRLNAFPGEEGTVAEPSLACSIMSDQLNTHYKQIARYSNARWVGFRRYITQDGFIHKFDGNATLAVVCTGIYETCSYNAAGTCLQWNLVSVDDTRTVAFGSCPDNTVFAEAAQQCTCAMGQDWEASVTSCVPIRDRNKDRPDKDACAGNPIYPLTGAKSKSVYLTKFSGQEIWLEYSTRKALGSTDSYFEAGQVVPPPAGAGPMWSINIQKQFYRSSPYQMIYLGRGKWDMFTGAADAEGEKSEGYGPDLRLLYKNNLWQVTDKLAGVQYHFSSSPSGYSQSVTPLIAFQPADGTRIELEQETLNTTNDWRSVSMLKVIKDVFGRQVQLQYEVPPAWDKLMPRLSALIDSNGTIAFSYNSQGMLQRITWPDMSYQEFLYPSGQGDKPWLLAGVRDENQALTGAYTYDDAGRALSTQSAGGANSYAVSRWQQAPLRSTVRRYDPAIGVIWHDTVWVDPQQVEVQTSSAAITMQSRLVNGMPRVTSQSQPSGSGCAAAVRRQDYDDNGNVTWSEDFKGYRTCFASNPVRNLETSRVEGLAAGSGCDAFLAAGSPLPTNARRISRQWHPIWRIETRMAEPRRMTTKIYNGQPDPFNGGATAACAPSSATLPDGSPIVVLCKQVEQATTDANGAQGFAAPLDATVPARVQHWTYNEYGQVLTAKDWLNNITTNAYYADTTADHTKGDLVTVTNALNQQVSYTKYNPAGQWLEMVDANGITTTRTFDLRQRLKSTTTAGLTTSYDYWRTGLLKAVTLPDASSVNYGYDDAHRLTSVTDNLGNKITYTLDNSGNRIAENVTDPGGKLAKTLARVPDALNRIQQIFGRE